MTLPFYGRTTSPGGGGGGGGGGSVAWLQTILAGMASDQWVQLTGANRPSNMDSTLEDLSNMSGGTDNRIPYGAKVGYDPINHQVFGCGGDHSSTDIRSWIWDLPTNSFSSTSSVGSHQYQHSAADPVTGDKFLMHFGTNSLRKYDGSTYQYYADSLYTLSASYISGALEWCGDRLVFVHSQGDDAWYYMRGSTTPVEFATGVKQVSGNYHEVAAWSSTHNRLLYGSGNSSGDAVPPVKKTVYSLTLDGTVSTFATAPYHFGVHYGMRFCGDGAGDWIFVGNDYTVDSNECYKLNGSGTITRMSDPPAAMERPHREDFGSEGNCVICATADELGCAFFIDFDAGKSPNRSNVFVRKA